MKVIRARVLGFCMGVRRAVETAWRESSLLSGRNVYTLGPLIHNPGVLEALEGRGIKILADGEFPPDPENSTVIIRAHGVSPGLEAEFRRRGCRIIDATCPHVKMSQKKARFFAERGYNIFLAGEKDHAEIAGVRGYAESALPGTLQNAVPACYVVGNPGEAESAGAELLRRDSAAKTVLIGQTTISPGEYRAIGEGLRFFFPALEIQETICGATADRQEALRELCAEVDAVIVAGGRDSANTRRLFSVAREMGKPAWLVESPGEIPAEFGAYKTAGLSAGASTPDRLIDNIEQFLAEIIPSN